MTPTLSGIWLLPIVWLCGWAALRWLGGRMTGGTSFHVLRWERGSPDGSVGDSGLVQAMIYSYGLRTLLGIALYAISFFHWPILPSLQFRFEPGFWFFGLDSHLYNSYGNLMALAWKQGTELPVIELGVEYFVLVAAIYWLLGPNPLYPILLNGWLGAATGLLAFSISRRLFSPRAARWGALLVTFWPSSLLWSAQLLKDSLSWFLVLSAIGLALRLAFDPRPRHRRDWVLWGLRWVGLTVTVMLVTRLRFYLGSALSLAAALILVPRGCLRWVRRLQWSACSTGGVAVVIVASTMVARTLNLIPALGPRAPELGHRRLAMTYWQQGNLDEAAREFERAISANPHDKPSYLGLAGVLIQHDRFDQALRAYLTYSSVADVREQAIVRRNIARSYLGLADHELEQGLFPSAMAGYERVLTFDSSVLSSYLYLGLVLTERGQFEAAEDMLQKVPPSRAADDRHRLRLVRERLAARERARTEEQGIHMALELLQEDVKRLSHSRQTLDFETQHLSNFQDAAAQRLASEKVGVAEEIFKLTKVGQELDIQLRALSQVTQASDVVELSPQLKMLEGAIGLAVAAVSPEFPRQSGDEFLESRGLSESGVFQFQRVRALEPQGFTDVAGDVFRQGLREVTGAAVDTVSETRPQELAFRREGFVVAGGYSLTDAWAKISTPWGLLTYLPKALLNGLIAPFPWQWFDVKGSTGMMRLLAGFETLAWYLLLPAMFLGSWGIIRSHRADQWFLFTVVVGLLVPMALVVANLGTLYRLRLLFLLPLLLIAAAGDPRGRYDALVRWAKAARTQRDAHLRRRVVGEAVTMPTNGGSSLVREKA